MSFSFNEVAAIVALLATFCGALLFLYDRLFFRHVKSGLEEVKDDLKSEQRSIQDKRIECSVKFTKLDDVPKTLFQIKDKLLQIELAFRSKFTDSVNQFSQVNSPKVLNTLGVELYEKSGAKKVLNDNIEKYLTAMSINSPTTALDVENIALNTLILNMDSAEFVTIKNYLYNNPKLGENLINMGDICFVMSLPLRDEYLKRHSEIPLD